MSFWYGWVATRELIPIVVLDCLWDGYMSSYRGFVCDDVIVKNKEPRGIGGFDVIT